MRPLNRPMFRYGGPIKEGVMSGIREPKRSGGAMKAALVGNPVYPKTDGREHHGFVALAGVPTAFTAARAAAMRYLPRIFQGAKKITSLLRGKNIPYSGYDTRMKKRIKDAEKMPKE